MHFAEVAPELFGIKVGLNDWIYWLEMKGCLVLSHIFSESRTPQNSHCHVKIHVLHEAAIEMLPPVFQWFQQARENHLDSYRSPGYIHHVHSSIYPEYLFFLQKNETDPPPCLMQLQGCKNLFPVVNFSNNLQGYLLRERGTTAR